MKKMNWGIGNWELGIGNWEWGMGEMREMREELLINDK
jgi:hypothetical protein